MEEKCKPIQIADGNMRPPALQQNTVIKLLEHRASSSRCWNKPSTCPNTKLGHERLGVEYTTLDYFRGSPMKFLCSFIPTYSVVEE